MARLGNFRREFRQNNRRSVAVYICVPECTWYYTLAPSQCSSSVVEIDYERSLILRFAGFARENRPRARARPYERKTCAVRRCEEESNYRATKAGQGFSKYRVDSSFHFASVDSRCRFPLYPLSIHHLFSAGSEY